MRLPLHAVGTCSLQGNRLVFVAAVGEDVLDVEITLLGAESEDVDRLVAGNAVDVVDDKHFGYVGGQLVLRHRRRYMFSRRLAGAPLALSL